MTAKLPPLLREIADVVGLPAALKLAEAKGGQRVFIPDRLDEHHWLCDLLGPDKAKALSFYLTHGGGTHLDVPKADMLRLARRNDMIEQLIAEGHSANEIAGHADLTRRSVFRYKAKLRDKADDPQISLFPDDEIKKG